MGSNRKGKYRLRTKGTNFPKSVGKFLFHAVRWELKDFVDTPLLEPLEPRDIRMKQNLGHIAEHWYCSFIIPNEARMRQHSG